MWTISWMTSNWPKLTHRPSLETDFLLLGLKQLGAPIILLRLRVRWILDDDSLSCVVERSCLLFSRCKLRWRVIPDDLFHDSFCIEEVSGGIVVCLASTRLRLRWRDMPLMAHGSFCIEERGGMVPYFGLDFSFYAQFVRGENLWLLVWNRFWCQIVRKKLLRLLF